MDDASPCRLEHAQAVHPSPNSWKVIPLSPNLSLLNERGDESPLSFCLFYSLRQELFSLAESKLGFVLFRSEEIAGLDSTDFWQQLGLGKTVVLAAK